MQSLYLHIPYCSRICTYCAFNTYEGMEQTLDEYVDALVREIQFVGTSRSQLQVHTIYFGGGTPSLMSSAQIEKLMATLNRWMVVLPDAEITFEANPNDLSLEYMDSLRQLGINRLSIGMQSANDDELRVYGREHTHGTTVEAIRNARIAGFHNVNLDLMFGNPNQLMRQWKDTLDAALALNPDHISLYGLEVKGGTSLKKQIDAGLLTVPNEDITASMYEAAISRLAKAGMRHYEISNWARAGQESRHNQQYWRNLTYLGLGAGAHGYAADHRTIVIRAPQRYITAMQNMTSQRQFPRTPATSKCIAVTHDDAITETIMLGLRMTEEGIQRHTFQERFGVDLIKMKRKELTHLESLGMIEITDACVRLTPKGYLLSNPIIAALV